MCGAPENQWIGFDNKGFIGATAMTGDFHVREKRKVLKDKKQ
jgi:hypothetical protein